jgi:hypothetical protein
MLCPRDVLPTPGGCGEHREAKDARTARSRLSKKITTTTTIKVMTIIVTSGYS